MTGTVQQLQGLEGKRTLLPPSGGQLGLKWSLRRQCLPWTLSAIGLFLSRADLAQLTSHFAV